jgi:hypothetical protein
MVIKEHLKEILYFIGDAYYPLHYLSGLYILSQKLFKKETSLHALKMENSLTQTFVFRKRLDLEQHLQMVSLKEESDLTTRLLEFLYPVDLTSLELIESIFIKKEHYPDMFYNHLSRNDLLQYIKKPKLTLRREKILIEFFSIDLTCPLNTRDLVFITVSYGSNITPYIVFSYLANWIIDVLSKEGFSLSET